MATQEDVLRIKKSLEMMMQNKSVVNWMNRLRTFRDERGCRTAIKLGVRDGIRIHDITRVAIQITQ